METSIKQLRKNIDRIDEQIITLICERQKYVQAIGKIKKDQNLPVYDHERELDSHANRKRFAKGLGLDPLRLEIVFEQIVLLARDSQRSASGGNHLTS